MLMLMEDKEYLLLRGSARSHHVLTRRFSAISSMTSLATAASKWKKSISMKSIPAKWLGCKALFLCIPMFQD